MNDPQESPDAWLTDDGEIQFLRCPHCQGRGNVFLTRATRLLKDRALFCDECGAESLRVTEKWVMDNAPDLTEAPR